MATAHVHRGRAMGTCLVIETTGPADLLDIAVERVADLERQWSRFLGDSDISRCNSTRGIPVTVGADTRTLVRHGIAAWERTNGACDPSVIDTLIASGYDRSFDQLPSRGASHNDAQVAPAVGCAGMVVSDELESVTLPGDAGFDPGAIGKGLAADLIVDELLAGGATCAFVSIGGDLRCGGTSPKGDGWAIPITEPSLSNDPLAVIKLQGGAVATSTDRRRRWSHANGTAHHIIEPTTGMSADTDASLVTVVAADAWWAEAVATQLFLARSTEWEAIAQDAGVAAFIVDHDASRHLIGPMQDYLR